MLPGPAAGARQAAGIGAAPRGTDCAGLLAGSSGSLGSAPSGDAPRAAVYGEGCGTRRLQSALYSWIPLRSAPLGSRPHLSRRAPPYNKPTGP